MRVRSILMAACVLPLLLATSEPAQAWYGACDCGNFGASSGAKHSLWGQPRGYLKDHAANTRNWSNRQRLQREGGWDARHGWSRSNQWSPPSRQPNRQPAPNQYDKSMDDIGGRW